MNLAQLHSFLEQAEIPEVKKPPKTFLGIAKQPHYENVLSNIYAFYFREKEEHGFQDLFIKSLMSLVKETAIGKDKTFNTEDVYQVQTEYKSKKRGRIDIIVKNSIEAIIIENKIYHHLNNDLDDYKNTIVKEGYEEANITCIVLSLRLIPSLHNPK